MVHVSVLVLIKKNKGTNKTSTGMSAGIIIDNRLSCLLVYSQATIIKSLS